MEGRKLFLGAVVGLLVGGIMKNFAVVLLAFSGFMQSALSVAEPLKRNSSEESLKSLISEFNDESDEIFLNDDEDLHLDELQFNLRHKYQDFFEYGSVSQNNPYQKLAHMMIGAAIWGQLKYQIPELIWGELRSVYEKSDYETRKSQKDLIEQKVEIAVGKEYLEELKYQIDLPIWHSEKIQILLDFWDEHFRNTVNHIHRVLANVDFKKAYKEGKLEATINHSIHYAFVQFQWTLDVHAHLNTHLEKEGLLAESIRRKLHRTDADIEKELNKVVIPQTNDVTIKHQIDLVCH